MTLTPLWFRVCLLGWTGVLLWLGLRYLMMPVALVGVVVLVFAIRPRPLHLSERPNVILLIVNMIGTCVYVWRASFGWVSPQSRAAGIPITGEPFVWFAAILPVVAVFLPLNVGWGAVILGARQWRSGRYWLSVAALWLIALTIDFAHH